MTLNGTGDRLPAVQRSYGGNDTMDTNKPIRLHTKEQQTLFGQLFICFDRHSH